MQNARGHLCVTASPSSQPDCASRLKFVWVGSMAGSVMGPIVWVMIWVAVVLESIWPFYHLMSCVFPRHVLRFLMNTDWI